MHFLAWKKRKRVGRLAKNTTHRKKLERAGQRPSSPCARPTFPSLSPTTARHHTLSMAGGPADKDLPRAEAALFRSIVKHYDAKAYKKGVKAADAILK